MIFLGAEAACEVQKRLEGSSHSDRYCQLTVRKRVCGLAGTVRTALVSAENLQLTLKTELSQEEQHLTPHTNGGPDETHTKGYCTEV